MTSLAISSFVLMSSAVLLAAGQTSNPSDFGLGRPATLSLGEALNVTLSANPQIGVQRQQVAFEKGVLRQASGAFDTNFGGSAGQNRLDADYSVARIEKARA